MPFTARWWNAPIFSPLAGAFALSETLLGATFLTTPLQWLGVSPVPAYNVLYVLSFPASALASHALALRLTGRHDAALACGPRVRVPSLSRRADAARADAADVLDAAWPARAPPLSGHPPAQGPRAVRSRLDDERAQQRLPAGVLWRARRLVDCSGSFDRGAISRSSSVSPGWLRCRSCRWCHLPEVQSGLGMSDRSARLRVQRRPVLHLGGVGRASGALFHVRPEVEGELYPGIVVDILVVAAGWGAWPPGSEAV